MAIISEEQRAKEIEDRKILDEPIETLTEDEKKELAANLQTRDRLMRRLRTRKVTTVLKDDLGEIRLDTRLLTGKERARFLQYNSAMAGLKELVADISLTPDLNRDYWMGDEVSDDVVLTVILKTFNGAAQAVREGVASFRP